jgi:hypothetical protein
MGEAEPSGSTDAAPANQPTSPGAPDADSSMRLPDAESPPRVVDAARDAAARDVDPSAFSAIEPGHGDTVSTPTGKWGFDPATPTCKAPYTAGSYVLHNAKQAGARICFVQLVVNKSTGEAFVQDGLKLWWRWNGVDQWTPEVTGDPRNPTPVPALGPNKLGKNANFEGGVKGWYAPVTYHDDASCPAPHCVAQLVQAAPEPGGASWRVTTDAVTNDAVFGTSFGVTVGKTYLISAWTTGTGGTIQADHDVGNQRKNGSILPTTNWVQAFCKHLSVKPDQSAIGVQNGTGSQLLKFYLGSNGSLAIYHPYVGEVDPTYPAPDCHL